MKEIKVSNVFSRGIVQGPAFLVPEVTVTISQQKVETKEEIKQEIWRFENAVQKISESLSKFAEKNSIFAGHVAIVKDFTLHDSVIHHIQDEHENAERATEETISELCRKFESMDNQYMKGRAADIADVGSQLIASMQNHIVNKFSALKTPSVIIAKDLAPSDTASLDRRLVLGFITEEGGVTSHVCIMAKSLNIPALVGAAGILASVRQGDQVILDAEDGYICVNPDSEQSERFKHKQLQIKNENEHWLKNSERPVITTDGRKLKVYANVGNIKDIEQAAAFNVNGIGLFRTEFLYMESDHFPTEDEQFAAYKKAVETLGHEIIIRTLDIGGDKKLSYYQFPPEENPFLGCRAIRFCLNNPQIFETQLRAILRASHFGPLRIMLPMLVSIEEAEESFQLLDKAKQNLRSRGIPFDENIPVGMMMETPAAMVCVEDFAEIMDFFSIGTNDLTQYVLAADRGNKEISKLYNSFNPAVLRSIARVIDAGHKANITVGMCGEFAGNPKAALLLLGLGLDEFSMAASSTPRMKDLLCKANFEEAKKRANEIIHMKRTSEIEGAVKEWCQ